MTGAVLGRRFPGRLRPALAGRPSLVSPTVPFVSGANLTPRAATDEKSNSPARKWPARRRFEESDRAVSAGGLWGGARSSPLSPVHRGEGLGVRGHGFGRPHPSPPAPLLGVPGEGRRTNQIVNIRSREAISHASVTRPPSMT